MNDMTPNNLSTPMVSKRQSNIELCRIISMLLIVFLHSTWSSIGFPQTGDSLHPIVLVLYTLSIVGVDVFLFISGWFSITIKKQSLFNLFWILLFYGVVRVALKIYDGRISVQDILFISKSNWFIVSYIGLILISPVLNSFIEKANSKQLGRVILALLLYETWFSIFPARAAIEPGFNNGCSLIWFVMVYLIARYFKLFGFPHILRRYCFMIYILSSCLVYILTSFSIMHLPSSYIPPVIGKIGAQNNIIILISAVSFFCCFERLSFSSRAINYIAKSTLAVLLVHTSIISPYMKEFYLDLSADKESVVTVLWWILGGIFIFSFSVLIDQFRILSQFCINKYLLWKNTK